MAALANYNHTTPTLQSYGAIKLRIPRRSVSEANEAWADWTRALRELGAATGEPTFPALANPQRDPFVDHFISTVLSGLPWMFIKYREEHEVYEGYVCSQAVVTQSSDVGRFCLHVGGSGALEGHEMQAFYGPCGWNVSGCIHAVGIEQDEYVEYFPSKIWVGSHVVPDVVKDFFKCQWRRYKESDDLMRLHARSGPLSCRICRNGRRRRITAVRYSGGLPSFDIQPNEVALETLQRETQSPTNGMWGGAGHGSEDDETESEEDEEYIRYDEDEELICKPWPCRQHWKSLTGEKACECPVCMEDTRELTHKMFSCGHFMCVSCINNSGFQWKCPICRVKIAERTVTLN